jgi:hypothetical protein
MQYPERPRVQFAERKRALSVIAFDEMDGVVA